MEKGEGRKVKDGTGKQDWQKKGEGKPVEEGVEESGSREGGLVVQEIGEAPVSDVEDVVANAFCC